MRSALFSLLFILSVPAFAEIYKYTDAQGNTVFTNQPPEGVQADTVDLPPANTVNIRTPEPPPPLPDRQQNQQAPYQTLRHCAPTTAPSSSAPCWNRRCNRAIPCASCSTASPRPHPARRPRCN